MKKLLVLVLLSVGCASATKEKVFNIKDYGAKVDGKTINTEAIQEAIDACSKAGGGTVLISEGSYLSGTILLKDNVDLKIEEGATLLASLNPNDFPPVEPFIDATGQFRGQCLVGVIDAKNVSITGKGTIDGQGKMFAPKVLKERIKKLGIKLKEPDLSGLLTDTNQYVSKTVKTNNRPFLVRVVRSKNIKLTDINLRQPAAWTLHFFQTHHFEVDGISIYSHANKNNDAIDIDSSTHGVIKNCTLDSGDDAICFKSTSPEPTTNVEVYDCKLSSHWGAIKFGTESMGDFRDIVVRDCFIHDTKGGGIKVLSADGAKVENILIEDIKMENVEMPIFIRLCERRLVYRNAKRKPTGSINNVTIRNIEAKVSDRDSLRMPVSTGFYFSGTPDHLLGKINIENVKVDLPGGATSEDAKRVVPENITEYPEFTKLGPTPAYGLFARHIKNLSIKDVSFSLRDEDAREEIVEINTNK
ncbi:glycoside hydrolase family 28 protein [Seonamhaeicola sp.]|uniref:glycoside hydrolase family 28 protein n=1 Tax=Seonamhaeicola sp. TaxID=1912245 RepID=UPI002622D0E2|nr:glycoside hydrolase family 28 protein [Seonamhaeicola sp.]